MILLNELDDDQYGLWFDVRRSIRYHDRRKAFYENCHLVTNLLTIFMSGVALSDLINGEGVGCLIKAVAAVAALFAALDMLLRYSTRAQLHQSLKDRFAVVELSLLDDANAGAWENAQRQRLIIERDEPVIYNALDALCRNELLQSDGFVRGESAEFVRVNWWQSLTCNLLRWGKTNFPYAK